jgi:hypothetical protein
MVALTPLSRSIIAASPDHRRPFYEDLADELVGAKGALDRAGATYDHVSCPAA